MQVLESWLTGRGAGMDSETKGISPFLEEVDHHGLDLADGLAEALVIAAAGHLEVVVVTVVVVQDGLVQLEDAELAELERNRLDRVDSCGQVRAGNVLEQGDVAVERAEVAVENGVLVSLVNLGGSTRGG